jgi:hypothetical protein
MTMSIYQRFRTIPLVLSSGSTLRPTDLPAGITEATACAIREDLNRNATINGRVSYTLQVRDIRDPFPAWLPLDAVVLPEVSGWSVCPDCGPSRCTHVVCSPR